MRIVTWNCNGALRKKYEALKGLDADILVVQECEDPAQSAISYAGWAGNYLWAGRSKSKGIGIFAKNGISIEKLDWPDDDFQQFLPCRVNDQFNLLAVWTQKTESSFQYIGQFWKYFQLNRERLLQQETVLCGDFNSNVKWDKYKWSNHGDVVQELERVGIHSMYHQAMGEEQGQEKLPTFFMHRNREKPYHIDYVFTSKPLMDVGRLEVGHPDQWLEISDHMPIVFNLSLQKVEYDCSASDESRDLLRKTVWEVLPQYEGQYRYDGEDSGSDYTERAIMEQWKRGLVDGEDKRQMVLLLYVIMFNDRMNSESGNFEYIDDHKSLVKEILKHIG